MIIGLSQTEIEEALIEALTKKTGYLYTIDPDDARFRLVDEYDKELGFSDMEYFVNVKGD